MQSSYSLIKNGFSKVGESKVITTQYISKHDFSKLEKEESTEESQIPKIDPEELLKRYEEIGERIVKDAQNEKSALLLRAQMEASEAEKRAYEKGYEQGTKNGYDDGYKKAYEENINEATQKADAIIEKAELLLKSAESEYNKYLEDKRLEIINLSLKIAENITRQKLSNDDSLNEIIEDTLRGSKGEESVIIRVNTVHVKALKANCERWKLSYSIKNDIFVVNDDFLEPGNAILEKSTGIIKVGIDIGMEKIRKSIMN